MSKQGNGPMLFGQLGKEQTDAMLGLQKELLEAYEQASQTWFARVKSEVELWSDLATKLGTTHSPTEAMEIYQQTVAQRMQMAGEDAKRASEDCQKIVGKVARSLSNGWPKGSS